MVVVSREFVGEERATVFGRSERWGIPSSAWPFYTLKSVYVTRQFFVSESGEPTSRLFRLQDVTQWDPMTPGRSPLPFLRYAGEMIRRSRSLHVSHRWARDLRRYSKNVPENQLIVGPPTEFA